MGSWRKLLYAMVADPDPRSYSYSDAAKVLKQLGFDGPFGRGGSHRRFRIEVTDTAAPCGKRGVIIGLVESGHGPLKPVYIQEMVRVLQENNLIPPDRGA